ncbi:MULTISPECIES: hypothetical protein [Streptomyces]|uniref:hypothetical protein n=1 Tax=Streptomyces TaxID=1883 RepID=UPI0010625C39|nr:MULTISPECIES: hypothetical protein [Streptomyces]TDU77106.1 hypothetical protein EDD91_3836 [Streptomyces sp. KS 21]
MRTRIPELIAAVILAVLGVMVPAAQAAAPAVTGPECVAGTGSVEYNSATGQWTCVGGTRNGAPID